MLAWLKRQLKNNEKINEVELSTWCDFEEELIEIQSKLMGTLLMSIILPFISIGNVQLSNKNNFTATCRNSIYIFLFFWMMMIQNRALSQMKHHYYSWQSIQQNSWKKQIKKSQLSYFVNKYIYVRIFIVGIVAFLNSFENSLPFYLIYFELYFQLTWIIAFGSVIQQVILQIHRLIVNKYLEESKLRQTRNAVQQNRTYRIQFYEDLSQNRQSPIWCLVSFFFSAYAILIFIQILIESGPKLQYGLNYYLE